MKDNEFQPADGVTLENALRYVDAIEKAVKSGTSRVAKCDRSMVITMISGALRHASDSLAEYRASLEEKGKADPVSDDQRIMLRELFRKAMDKNPTS